MTFPNRKVELLQALTDGKQLEFQYVNPCRDMEELRGEWFDLEVRGLLGYNTTAMDFILGKPLDKEVSHCEVIVRIKDAA